MSAVGIDIDDVLYPWYATAHDLCVAAGITNGQDAVSWKPYADYGCTMAAWHDVLSTSTLGDGGLYSALPYDGVVEQLQRLRDAGHTIHLVTARGFLANGDLIKSLTIDWLAKHQIPHDSLTFSKDKALVITDFFLDDAVHNYEALLNVTEVWLLDAAHNTSVPDNRYRVGSVEEFVDHVLGVKP